MDNGFKSIILFVSKAFTVMVNIVSMMIISRFLPLEMYSNYREINTVLTLVISVASLGLPSSILYFMSSNKRHVYLPNFFMAMLFILMLLLPISIISLFYFNYNFNTFLFTEYWVFFILLFLFSFVGACIENLFIAFNTFKLLLINSFIPNLVFICSLFYTCYYKQTLVSLLLCLISREFIRILILLYFAKVIKVESKHFSMEKTMKILTFGVPIGAAALIGAINTNLDKLIIGKFFTEKEFAVIATASYEIPILGLIGVSLFNILIPSLKDKYDNNRYSELIELWYRAGKVMITVVIPIVVALIVFANEIVTLIFSSKYIDAVNLFRVYQVNALSRIYYYGSLFLALGLSRLYTRNAIINLINNLILNIVCIKVFGMKGAAVANVISAQLLIFIQTSQLKKVLKVKSTELFPIIEFIKGTVLTFMITICIYVIYKYIFDFNIYIGLVFMIIAMVLSILMLSKVITNEILIYLNMKLNLRDKLYGLFKKDSKKMVNKE